MTAVQPNVSIIGIGDDGLDAVPESVRRLILDADLLVGKERTLALVPEADCKRLAVGADLEEVVQQIQSAGDTKTAVLVSGDPLFYGLARFLCDRLGNDRCEIVPHVSSMQMAFARVKESWDEAYLTNLAQHDLDVVVERIRTAEKVGLFTTEEFGPSAVAQAMLDRRIDYFTIYVCENLGARNERVTRGSVAEIAKQSFEPLNVMVLVRDSEAPGHPRDPLVRSLFGNPDEVFIQSKPKHGLLTPAEVRSMALAQMALDSKSIVWDIGAGSGSVSVEAAQLAPGGQIFAIEQDADDIALIRENAERFGVANVTPVLGKAPEAWADLPDADAVFLEGSGREVVRIAELAFNRLNPKGRLVANVVSIQALSEVREALTKHASQVHVWMINVARGTDQLERLRFDALNPTFLVAAEKL
ncbi:MAG: precorrin-6y C5,15-methyltransferase (decarboxylating) subunit CbiE [Planctomycetales bacterium]|nr:precorrin-6y C5,15-methyltransferase (decarboxylating) subunit CbiE [Planctomycetales bacterium]